MSFKDVTESMVSDFIFSALNEKKVTIDVDHTGEDIKATERKYKIKIKHDGETQAYITGDQKNVLKFLKGPEYDMDMDDIEELYPELLESKKAPVTDKDDDGEGMDPVGKGDADIDNDGDSDESDEYLAKRRKAISKSVKKEDVDLTEATTFTNLSDWLKAVIAAGGGSTLSQAGTKFSASLGRNKSATFDLKKQKGSMSESVELEEAFQSNKPNTVITNRDNNGLIIQSPWGSQMGESNKFPTIPYSDKEGQTSMRAIIRKCNDAVNKVNDKTNKSVMSLLEKAAQEIKAISSKNESLEEGFKKGDSVKIKNAKSYDSLAKDEVMGTVTGMDGDKVKVKVGTGSMTVDAKDLMKESLVLEGALGDYKELIKFANSDGGADKGDMLKAAALMAKGDKAAFKKHVDDMDKYPADIVKSYAD